MVRKLGNAGWAALRVGRPPPCPALGRAGSRGRAASALTRVLATSVMDKRASSGRGEAIPSILKKPKGCRKGDLFDKSSKIKREKVEVSARKSEDVSAPLPQGCTPLMYACQQADYKAVVEALNKDVSGCSSP